VLLIYIQVIIAFESRWIQFILIYSLIAVKFNGQHVKFLNAMAFSEFAIEIGLNFVFL